MLGLTEFLFWKYIAIVQINESINQSKNDYVLE